MNILSGSGFYINLPGNPDYLKVELFKNFKANYLFSGVIIICARCVPGSINQGIPGTSGFSGNPVDSAVA